MDKIYLSQMEFYGYHGALPEENKLGQRFSVDLTVYLDLREAGQTDQLDKTVNYTGLYETVKDIVEGDAVRLIETVAHQIAEQLFMKFQLIDQCAVKVTKPDPPIPGHYRSVAVEITRRRP